MALISEITKQFKNSSEASIYPLPSFNHKISLYKILSHGNLVGMQSLPERFFLKLRYFKKNVNSIELLREIKGLLVLLLFRAAMLKHLTLLQMDPTKLES